MRVKFIKDITVDVMEPSSGTNDTYDKLMRRGTEIEVNEIVPVSSGFSTLWLDDTALVDVRNDSFTKAP